MNSKQRLSPVFACGHHNYPGVSQQPSTDTPYLDPKQPVEQRVNDLISRMTVEEKASQLGHTAASIPRLHIPEYNWWNEGLHA